MNTEVGINIVDHYVPRPAALLNIGTRLELFVDHHLIEHLDGVALRLHAPQRMPAPASPLTGGFMTVIKDGGLYRGYYREMKPHFTGEPVDGNRGECTCYAESRDGREWERPRLNLVTDPVFGSLDNAILGESPFSHNLSPVLDTRPDVPAEERFKALAGVCSSGLYAFASGDGIHWRKLRDQPVIRHDPILHGEFAFDSQNVSFWSEAEQRYVCYFRHWKSEYGGPRTIGRAVSDDYIHWTDESAVFASPTFDGEQLYTNQTHPYFRAPHIYIALPTRFSATLGCATDIMFMTTRAGAKSFNRTFTEAFIRPGLDQERWGNRANYVALNVVPNGPAEISIYHKDGHRYVLRTDGFASIHASAEGGECVTKPLVFSGSHLVLNLSTSIRGGVRVELQDAGGSPFPGFALDDGDPIIGDSIETIVTWRGQGDLSRFAGRPIRIRFALQDSDLYSFQFQESIKPS